MLKDGVVLLVIFLIVVGGIFAWWTQTATRSSSPTVEQIPELTAAPKSASTIAKAIRKPKPARAMVSERPATVEAREIPQVATPDPVVQTDPPPFPSVEKIAIGLPEDSITRTYGDPALSAMTSNGGHTIETFVYAPGGDGLATVVRFVDGRVFAVYSQSGPTRPVGVSAQPRWRKR
jgi:hypothetical protein